MCEIIVNRFIYPVAGAISFGAIGKACLIVGGIGLLIGILLGIAAKFFAVEKDPRIDKVRELLPGSNCGGCGFAGCDALAEAIVAGNAKPGLCSGTGDEKVACIAAIMGTEAEKTVRKVAYVHCHGTCDKTKIKYHYHGIPDCRKLALIPGHGEKLCISGCMGYGSCNSVCPTSAICVVNGVAVVEQEKCIACGKCVAVCPNHLIELIPVTAPYVISCSSTQKGKDVKAACEVGCIGCGICAKLCPNEAIVLDKNLAKIDYEKCQGCGICAAKCPQKVILMRQKQTIAG